MSPDGDSPPVEKQPASGETALSADANDGRGLRRLTAATTGTPALLLYLAAAVSYVTLGVFWEVLIFSWATGTAFLLLVVWLIPALVARWR